MAIQPTFAAKLPAKAIQQLAEGKPIDLVIEYDTSAIEQEISTMPKSAAAKTDNRSMLRFRQTRYQSLKSKNTTNPNTKAHAPYVTDLADYSHLPLNFKRFNSLNALNDFVAMPHVKAVYLNERKTRALLESLPLINQPDVMNIGAEGAGTAVAVLDDGIDYTKTAFGNCTAPNAPATCRVLISQSFGTATGFGSGHGTNVSAVVLGVAPASKIIMLNVFDTSGGAYVSDIIDAINWSIANRATYNIVSINMSLGGGDKFTSTCRFDWSASPITQAKNAGIHVVVASGNSAYIDGLTSPACAPDAISVGAVYDANAGSVTYGGCVDATTATDKVTCFSNSANYLTMLAPGYAITAAGISQGGTSQAAPHVAGAIAVLRANFPNETPSQIQTRLTSAGTAVLDVRNNISKPRLNLLQAARPANDLFANRITLTGANGSISQLNLLATRENNEPNHAGIFGSQSVWWKWTATANGQVSLTTTGSDFDTLLAAYSGNNLNALTALASNNNANASSTQSQLVFQAIAGQQYQFAVDGLENESGLVNLNWVLNTAALANLSVSTTGPSSVNSGNTVNYALVASNAGPQAATNTLVTLSLPTNVSLISATPACSVSNAGQLLTCNAGTLPSGASAAFNIQLLWGSSASTSTLLATVRSDVADNNNTDNSITKTVSLNAPTGAANDTADIPTLPEWGMIIMAGLMMLIQFRARPYRT